MLFKGVISCFSVEPEELELVKMLKDEFPDINNLYNSLIKKTDKIVKDLEKVYIDLNDGVTMKECNKRDFQNECEAIHDIAMLYFAFKVCFKGLIKSNDKYEQLAYLYNVCNNDKKSIVKNYDKQVKLMKEEIQKFKKSATEQQRKDNEESERARELLEKERLEKAKETVIVPSNYGKQKKESMSNYVQNNLKLAFSDLKLDENGNIIINGKVVNDSKIENGFRKIDPPRNVKDDDEITISKSLLNKQNK